LLALADGALARTDLATDSDAAELAGAATAGTETAVAARRATAEVNFFIKILPLGNSATQLGSARSPPDLVFPTSVTPATQFDGKRPFQIQPLPTYNSVTIFVGVFRR